MRRSVDWRSILRRIGYVHGLGVELGYYAERRELRVGNITFSCLNHDPPAPDGSRVITVRVAPIPKGMGTNSWDCRSTLNILARVGFAVEEFDHDS